LFVKRVLKGSQSVLYIATPEHTHLQAAGSPSHRDIIVRAR
jgi:hypothetical protein